MVKILSALSWVGIALVFGAVVVRFTRPEWDAYAMYALWTGLALVILYSLSQWRDVVTYFQRRNARYGAIASASVVIVLGILIAVNYLSTRQNKRWDLTANQRFSLSDQTVKLLRGLDAPVKFVVLDQDANFDQFRARMADYQYHSKQVAIEYLDPEKRPVQARQYEVQSYPTVVVEHKGRTERVTSVTEQDLTNALIKTINPQRKKVYFIGGHGEKDILANDRPAYSAIADALKKDNYEVDKLVLAQTNEVPADTTLLVLAGPRTDLLESEVPLLNDYLGKAGKLLVLLDPPENLRQPTWLPRLEGLLKEWGLDATRSIVVDMSGRTRVATVPVAGPPYPGHAITDRFDLITMFPFVRAITPATGTPNRTAQTFVQTAARTWAETNLSQLEDAQALAPETDKGDIGGPVSVAAAVAVPTGSADAKPAAAATPPAEEPKKPETRIAAIGDSDFASNGYVGVEGNRDLFMNTVSWLAQQENLIAIRPREAADRRITVTARQRDGLFWMSVLLIPALVFGTGAYTWWRRR